MDLLNILKTRNYKERLLKAHKWIELYIEAGAPHDDLMCWLEEEDDLIREEISFQVGARKLLGKIFDEEKSVNGK